MKKILQIGIGETFGGIEKLELEYAKYINNDLLQIDILSPNKKAFQNVENTAEKCNIFDLNIPEFTRKNEILYDYRLYKFLKHHKYDIIHINSEVFFFSFRVILIAKLCGVKKVVMHTHGNIKVNPLKHFLITILNPFYRRFIDKHLSCSKLAQNSLYTKSFIHKNKIIILKNGLEIEKYKFNEETRKQYRNDLQLGENKVYGHIGRFSSVKNHSYLINLFYHIQKIQEHSILVLIGDGKLKEAIQKQADYLKISDKVLFLGQRNDANLILNTFDVFLFPSLHEGLGMATIEAQTNGLLTFCSETISPEAKISNSFKYFSLDDPIEEVAKRICKDETNSFENRKKAYENTIENGYVIEDICKKLEKIYLSL